jgi:hypothetical protein
MENSCQAVRYLTIEDILSVAEGHVGSYQLLHESQLRYLVEIVGEKWGNTELFPLCSKKLLYMPITLLLDTYF